MQIEQNFRDKKSERFGFGLRASHSHSAGTESAGNPGDDSDVAVGLSC